MGTICCKNPNIKIHPKSESDIKIDELHPNSVHNEIDNNNNNQQLNINEFSNNNNGSIIETISNNNKSSHINIELNIINNESSNNNNNINQIWRVCVIEILGQAIGNGIFELASDMITCCTN